MKKTFLIVALLATVFLQKSYSQEQKINLPDLLHIYYDIKNALVSGNANLASEKAEAFVKSLDQLDVETLSADDRKTFVSYNKKLSGDAQEISKSKDLKDQRTHFADFSSDMYSLAKAIKLSADPIYYDYCPMKKAYWLSREAGIKNPYYGSSMLTCGKVQETLK